MSKVSLADSRAHDRDKRRGALLRAPPMLLPQLQVQGIETLGQALGGAEVAVCGTGVLK